MRRRRVILPQEPRPFNVKSAAELTDRDLERYGEWVKESCILAGSEIHTAYICAGYFVQGLEDLRRKALAEARPS